MALPTSDSVPFLDLSRHVSPLQEEIEARLARVVRSGCFVLGPEIDQFESTLAQYCGTAHAIACASGSEALLMALMALRLQHGDEVIVPSFTFFATASAVSRLGGTPVFADIDPLSCNISPESVRERITPRTKAIIVVHLYGRAAPMEAFLELAQEFHLPLIEDAAQAIGASAFLAGGEKPVGSMGEIGCFSFYPTKNLGAMGDGGALTTNDDELARSLRLLRGHGMAPRYYHQIIGINGRLDAFQGAVLNVKFPHLEVWTTERENIARRYFDLFAQYRNLEGKISLFPPQTAGRHVWNQFCVRVLQGRRDALRSFLAERKIGTEIYYPLGLHEQQCFSFLGYLPDALPITHKFSREILALPIFPGLSPEEQQIVVENIVAFFEQDDSNKTRGVAV
ncbi:MAG: DegT/DnrJ/EryC1/StrS family aminotransferase [Planctomycetia bacterium]|nr:DegT/DnrJ/EryC1/StrS family aminotransferase [Planctomycetia bacterium]